MEPANKPPVPVTHGGGHLDRGYGSITGRQQRMNWGNSIPRKKLTGYAVARQSLHPNDVQRWRMEYLDILQEYGTEPERTTRTKSTATRRADLHMLGVEWIYFALGRNSLIQDQIPTTGNGARRPKTKSLPSCCLRADNSRIICPRNT